MIGRPQRVLNPQYESELIESITAKRATNPPESSIEHPQPRTAESSS